jgi:hypothetical protein
VIVGGFIVSGESGAVSFERARDAVLAMARRVIAGQPAGVPKHVAVALFAVAGIEEDTGQAALHALALSEDTEPT